MKVSSLRVLHLPTNTASIPSHTVHGLRGIGVDARGLVMRDLENQSAEGLKIMDPKNSRQWSPMWVRSLVRRFHYFVRWVSWADIVHWYFDSSILPFGLDLKMIKVLKKPAVVEWLGSDIRIPEIEFEDNPYYKAAFPNGYEYQSENYQRSRQTQKRFVKAGFVPVVIPCMIQYIQKDICPRFYKIWQPIRLDGFIPRCGDRRKRKPLIVHVTSAPVAKGTAAVLKAVDRLKKKYDFEFILIQGMIREKVLELIQQADIFLDQFVIGYYGMAALEAMGFGKPVLCYIKPSLLKEEAPDLPIVNANPENLVEPLEAILCDGRLRYEIGKRSRAYVEKYHDATKVAHQLVDIYQEVIKERRRRSSLCI